MPLHRFAVLTAVATLGLIFAGGLVTSTESGLSVPDWPLSYGKLMPPMVGGVAYEHGHRMVATTVGILTIILAVWLARREPRRSIRRLGWIALGAVVLQGILGGLTVRFLLPTPISVAHACLAQTFFCLTVVLAVVTSPRWERGVGRELVTRLAIATASAVFLQLLIGAVMRHNKAGLAIPDFPLSLGRVIPPLDSFPVLIAFAHRAWALVVAALVFATIAAAARSGRRGLRRTAMVLGAIVIAQIALGATTILSRRGVAITTAHVAAGALLLGTAVALAIGSLARPLLTAVSARPAERKVFTWK
ncbi:MAG TPA: COX15/CtaA family protein [Thermoanaerobaculia bacterium]|jgi:cytochrome c oxidase assembly protein subunit 15|nr:COX15/CtaA family protein [Thermoanaerobaculia bacterium]